MVNLHTNSIKNEKFIDIHLCESYKKILGVANEEYYKTNKTAIRLGLDYEAIMASKTTVELDS